MRSMIRKNCIAVMVAVWTVAVGGLAARYAFHLKERIQALAIAEARLNYNKGQTTPSWAAFHGGVYVPVAAQKASNPDRINIPASHVVTARGNQPTSVEPAKATSTAMGNDSELFGVKAHIVSLRRFSKAAAPDVWEKKALLAFAKGRSEAMEVAEIDGKSYLRLMRPLKAETSCLKCHQEKGYRRGAIRGGVSLSIPMKPYLTLWHHDMIGDVISFGMLWLLGILGLAFYNRKIFKSMHGLAKTEAALCISQDNYRTLVENSLTGIYVSQDDHIVFANPEFAYIHGYELDKIIGLPSLSIIHPDDRRIVAERLGRTLEGRPRPDEYRVRGLTKYGATIYVQRRNALTSYNGQPAVIGSEIDVTGSMVAEAELAASERQLQKLADALIELREIEHERFTKDIHENIAQCLSAIKLQVESVIKEGIEKQCCETHQRLHPVIVDVQYTLGEIRKIARKYHPIGLEHLGILPSLEWLCTRFESAFPGIHIEKAFRIDESDIPEPLKVIIFRMAEQILNSVSGHPAAGVKMGLDLTFGKIVFHLQTNVNAADLSSSPDEEFLHLELAMITLKRRIEKFGGSFQLSSDQEKGTVFIATWEACCRYPIDRPETGAAMAQDSEIPIRRD